MIEIHWDQVESNIRRSLLAQLPLDEDEWENQVAMSEQLQAELFGWT